MAELDLKFLGDFRVLRDRQDVALPPSKKTRALLAYLSLNRRRFRREYLCELLWEIPDDPRGSLRWSLSKLRRVVDSDAVKRIVADRSHVEFDDRGVVIDQRDLLAIADSDLQAVDTVELEQAAARYQGNFLEGLELSNLHDFHAWCVAERERVLRAQAALLSELVRRHRGAPESALPFARRLVALSPYDEEARAGLVRLLLGLRHTAEAEQQFLLGMRMLKEIGAQTSGALLAARRAVAPSAATPSEPATTPPKTETPIRTVAGPTDLTGRESELAQIRQVFDAVRDASQARLVMLSGEAGIGKSRLVGAAMSIADDGGALLLRASAYESETLRPFALWIDALRRRLPDAAAEIFTHKTADNRERLLEGLSQLIATEADDGPVAVLFDDVHWCDESSAAAMHFVARMNRERPLLLLLAGRSSETQDNKALQQLLRGLKREGMLAEIELGPLSVEAIRELIEQQAPGADAERLSRTCGGNPLLAIELARAELEGETANSLNDLVRERLARFDLDGAEVLRWAAVLGPPINLNTLVTLTGFDADQVGTVLESAERQGMLTSNDAGLRFSHDLITRGVYTDISPLRRQVMHRRVATLLEESTALDLSRAADLAHHAAQSGDAGLAARAMVSAGRLCLRFFANDEASNLVRKGMQLVDALPDAERVCVSIDLHDILLAAAPVEDWEAAAEVFASLAEQAVDHGELAHARLGYHLASMVRWLQGHWSDARELSLQSERVTRSGPIEEHIVGMAETAKCLVLLERDLPQADAMLMEADALANQQGVSHHALPSGIGMLRFHENRLDEAEELLKQGRTLCKAAGDRINEFQCNEYLAMIALERRDLAGAAERGEVLLEIGGKLREGSEGPFARAIAGLCVYARNDNYGPLDTALEELRVADAKHRLAYVQIKAAQLDLEGERLHSAIERAGEALELATLLQRPTEIALSSAILAAAGRASADAQLIARHQPAMRDLSRTTIARWALSYIDALDADQQRVIS